MLDSSDFEYIISNSSGLTPISPLNGLSNAPNGAKFRGIWDGFAG
jgi:hypothetical protein